MKIVLFANTDWYLFNFRRPLAEALRERGYQVILLSPAGPYGTQLKDAGFQWTPVPMSRRSLNPTSELRLLFWLYRFLSSNKVDLIHGFTIKCAIYGCIAARMAGIRARVSAVAGMGYVFTSDDQLARALRPVVRALMKFAFGGPSARLILQNPDDVALFKAHRLARPDHIRLIKGSGVNCDKFTPATEHKKSGTFSVLLPARLLWDKGISEFIGAAEILQKSNRKIEFLMAGLPDPGNPASVPRSAVDSWTAAGLVKWLGHVSDMPSLFRSVHAVALPSYREGLPKGLIEAAACALPLITTDAPGCREVVDHGISGLIVPVKDTKALADAIAYLYDNPEICRRLGNAARAKALSEFAEQSVVDRTIDVYREIAPHQNCRLTASSLDAD